MTWWVLSVQLNWPAGGARLCGSRSAGPETTVSLLMGEDLFDYCRVLDAGDHIDGVAALLARSLQIMNTRLNPKRTLKHSYLESPEGSVLPKV